METPFKAFILALAVWMADQAEIKHTETPRQLFAFSSREEDADPTYAVLAPYAGPERAWTPVPEVALQLMVIGGDAFELASKLHGTLTDEDGRPLRNQAIEGFTLRAVLNLRGPGLIGRDEDERPRYTVNFDCKFVAA